MSNSQTDRLIAWINTHDCGVTPTAVLNLDGKIDVRCQAFSSATGVASIETVAVSNLEEARAALGY